MQIRFGYEMAKWKKNEKAPVVWDSDLMVNGHVLLIGMSGSGKTYTLRKMIYHMLQSAGADLPRIHIMDVHGDIEVEGASSVLFSEQTHYGLNPLRINPDPHFGGVRKRIQSFLSTMNKSMRAMGPKQEACLRNILTDIYEAYGFKMDDYTTWRVDSDTAIPLTDGDPNKLFIDVPLHEKDEAKALGARWAPPPCRSWWVPVDQYTGAITRWPPKLVGRTHPTVKDALRMAQNLLQMSFLGTGAEAVSYLEVANKAAAAYRKKIISSLRKGETKLNEDELTDELEKAKQKAIDAYTNYAHSIATGAELRQLMKYDSTDVLKSVVDRLTNLDASGIFKGVQPPFDPACPIWHYNIHALSMVERKLFVLFRLEEIFLAAVQRGQQDKIRDVIILDEAHIYADDDEENIINSIALEARKFGVALIAASQAPNHFTQDFITSVATKVILGVDEGYWKGAATKMRLKEEALAWVTHHVTMLVQMKRKGENKNEWIWTVIG